MLNSFPNQNLKTGSPQVRYSLQRISYQQKYRFSIFLEQREALATLGLHLCPAKFPIAFAGDVDSPCCQTSLGPSSVITAPAWTLAAFQFLTLDVTTSVTAHTRPVCEQPSWGSTSGGFPERPVQIPNLCSWDPFGKILSLLSYYR